MINTQLDPNFWKQKKVLLTGGAGFLGKALAVRIAELGSLLFVPRKREYNFTTLEAAERAMKFFKPEMVVHSAAFYGGLGITLAEPGKIYYENLVMGANLMEASRLHGVKKFVSVGTACSYPGHLEDALQESDLWAGPIHASVQAYGSVKKMLAIQGNAYRKQYGLESIHVIPSNLYGPNDCFEEYRAHVVGALIKKFVLAARTKESVSVWGTGKAIREFLYVDDCADGILLAAQKYNEEGPLNIGTGVGTTIRELVDAIVKAVNFRGRVEWDSSKPDGQLVKFLDITKMRAKLGWTPRMSLEAGVQATVDWFEKNYKVESFSKAA